VLHIISQSGKSFQPLEDHGWRLEVASVEPLAERPSACTPFTTITSSSGTAPAPVVAYNSLTAGSASPDRLWKTYRADSGYQIRYPLNAHSVRDTTCPSIDATCSLYPGAKVVEPHDLPFDQVETSQPKVDNG
jgi:hypothetical protein